MQLIGVDTGGTFTDAVIVLGDGREAVGKALSTPGRLEEGVLASIEAAAGQLDMSLTEVIAGCDFLAHGTTAGLNALLTRTGARVGLLTTAGFEATVPMARANTVRGIDEAFKTEAVKWDKPPLLLRRRQIKGVPERIDADGAVIRPLDEAAAAQAVRELGRLGVEAIGISLLWAHVNPVHELRMAELVADGLQGVQMTLSSQLAPRLGEYERTMTVVLNAYVLPLMAEYLGRLETALADRGFRGSFLLAKNGGGVERASSLAARPVETLNSGPVGGLTASGAVGRQLGHTHIVATDVGGTSFDVGLVVNGRARIAPRPLIDRYDIASPLVDIVSIGTGGGSIAWLDQALGSLRVGPASAGADPGPACYGRGGTRPTVTDAAAVLGYVSRVGALSLDLVRAQEALDRGIAGPLGLEVEQAADGVLQVASNQMSDLVRRTTLMRGHDPADFALYAYGGAAPQYVGRYAGSIGVKEAVVPRLASVFSAYGAVASDVRSTATQDLDPVPFESSVELCREVLAQLERRAGDQVGADHGFSSTVHRRAGLRFFRQVNELAVEFPDGAVDADLLATTTARFRADYETLVGKGTSVSQARVELVSLAVDVVISFATGIERIEVEAAEPPIPGRRPAWFEGAWQDVPVYGADHLHSGAGFAGPSLVELATTTLVVYPGQRAVVGPYGHLGLELGPIGEGDVTDVLDAVTFEVLRHRLLAINDEATFTIMQVSANQIATDSNDLNSALMTADGEVVVFGVWILVHSCSVNTMVKRILEDYSENPGIGPGDMFISNDPYITGRHQLDVVVVAPLFVDDQLVAWTGTIVHQGDVGGPVAGGFAVGARDIYGEAMPMAPMKIVEAGTIRRDVEREYLIRSRNPELNRLDLLAQIAANRVHGERVHELCRQYGADRFTATLDRLLDSTEARLRQRLASLPDGRWRHVSFMEHDGVKDDVYRIALTMTKRGDHLDLDFTDSSDQAQGMVNAPHGSLRCFAIVALLALLGFDDMPWVPGAFERVVTFLTREGTVTHAKWPAGVSMAGTAAGQEIRTAVQQCLAAMLDASEEWQDKLMTSGMTSAPGTAISGVDRRGERFSSILVDAQLGGGGARRTSDGADTAGLLHSPGATTSNIELNERNFPVLYLHRLERPDSGGPGTTRGGVGSEHAWALRPPHGGIDLVLFGHGVQQPTSAGFAGGEHGLQNGFLLERECPTDVEGLVRGEAAGGRREVPEAKLITILGPRDVFTSWCAGGGGMGDPVERDADAVRFDVEEGLVSPEGAVRDYGVVVVPDGEDRGWSVDDAATDACRRERLIARLGGAHPAPRLAAPATGRRIGACLVVTDIGEWGCRLCGRALGPSDRNVKESLVVVEVPTWERWPLSEEYEGATRFVLRRFFCPGCAVQMFVEVNLKNAPPVWSVEV